MGDIHGYIELKPEIVINAARKFLSERDERQEKRKAEYIKRQMSKRFFPARTPEDAEKRAWDMGFCAYHLGGGYWANMVESILFQAKTAKAMGGKIYISDDVHDCIGRFIDGENNDR